MARASMMDILAGLQIKDNPNAVFEMIMLFVILALLAGASIFLARWPKIKRRLWDEEVFKFLMEYKELSIAQENILFRMIKKNKISPKYNIVVLEAVFQKYLEMEVRRIEQSNMGMLEKEEAQHKYFELKEKLFPSDI